MKTWRMVAHPDKLRKEQGASMSRTIHIAQDEYGFWFMSLEEPDGTLKLLAHHFPKPDHLIDFRLLHRPRLPLERGQDV